MSNTLRNLMSRGGLSFAHLGRSQPRASDDNDPPPDDDSGKGKKGKRAADGDPDDDDDDDEGDDGQQNRENGDSRKGKKGKRADDGDPDDDDDSGKGKKGKRASDGDPDDDDDDDNLDAEDDDDDEEEMRGKSAAAKARRRERARCAAIFASKGAARNPVLAAKLAFESSMPRSEAIAVLNGSPAPEGSRGRRQNPQIGTDGDRGASSEQAIAASWDRAFKAAGAQPRRAR
ncbi:MAG: hypothetical protein RXR20_16530 [Paraburkholderia sp.]|uniref:hypothetical protein n=1 Tax=Burkholderiaceae TaxID=119060 RepID=UPI001484D3BF|nr:hypothetical protein [Burkholderia sp. 4M9327F10]